MYNMLWTSTSAKFHVTQKQKTAGVAAVYSMEYAGSIPPKKRLKPPDFSIHQSPTSTRASSLKCNTQTPANLSSDMTLAAGPTQQLVHGLCISSAWCRACCRNPDLVIVESMAEETMAFPGKCCPLKQSNGSVLFGDLSWASFLTRGKDCYDYFIVL